MILLRYALDDAQHLVVGVLRELLALTVEKSPRCHAYRLRICFEDRGQGSRGTTISQAPA